MLRLDSDQEGWLLEDAEARQRDAPDTFRIPPSAARIGVQSGDRVQLCFFVRSRDAHGLFIHSERLWVAVERVSDTGFVSHLETASTTCTELLRRGEQVTFGPSHVAAIEPPARA